MPQAFLITNSRHSFLSYTILLVCFTFKPLFFKQLFTESVHLLCDQSTKRLPTRSPTYTLLALLSFSIPSEKTFVNSLIHSFRHPEQFSTFGTLRFFSRAFSPTCLSGKILSTHPLPYLKTPC